MRRTLVPFAAALLLAGCLDSPTVPTLAPEVGAAFSEDQSPRPSAVFYLKHTGCVWNVDNTVDCSFRLTDVTNIPVGGKVLVQTEMRFAGTYVCVNTKNGKVHAKLGGSYLESVIREFSYDTFGDDLVGSVTLTPALPKELCGKAPNQVPEMQTISPVGMGIYAHALYWIGGQLHSHYLDGIWAEWNGSGWGSGGEM